MITLRQHVTSLVAVFLALAVGLVLGGAAFAGGDDGVPRQSFHVQGAVPPAAGPGPAVGVGSGVHAAPHPSQTGRSSTVSPGQLKAAAISSARSCVATSMTKNPARCSSPWAYGPSAARGSPSNRTTRA